jgi:hypothetical protein
MKTLPLLLGAIALGTSSVSAELESPIRALSSSQSLRSGVGVQAGVQPGSHLITGPDFSALVDTRGLELTPFLGKRAPTTQHLRLSFQGIAHGAVNLAVGAEQGPLTLNGTHAERPLGLGIVERFDASEAGVEVSYLFPARPAGSGDLVVALGLDSTFGEPTPTADGGLEFLLDGVGGVRIGAVTGIDADGDQAAGSLEFRDGQLFLRLPGSFVDSADYPMVLDPLVGSVLSVAPDSIFGSTDDLRPDAAFDASTDQYLVVWERQVSATESRIFGRRISSNGTFNNSAGQLSVVGGTNRTCHNPAVCNVNRNNKFVVVYEMSENALFGGTSYSIQMLTLDANYGSVIQVPQLVFGSTGGAQLSPDVCGEGIEAGAGVLGDFLVVWDDNSNLRLAYRHYGFDNGGALDSSDPVTTLVNDNTAALLFHGDPAIARSSGVYGKTMVVYNRFGTFGGNTSIRAQGLNITGSVAGSSVILTAPATGTVARPDIDGFDRTFVAAWEYNDGSNNVNIRGLPISLDVSVGTTTPGALAQFTTTSSFADTTKPAVGFSYGKTWIGYRSNSILTGTSSLAIRGFDTNTCVACEGAFTLGTGAQSSDEWIAVATPTSGGAYYDDRGLAVWSAPDSSSTLDVNCQLLVNNAQAGSYTNLGGGCGTAGTLAFNGAPSIGSSWWYTSLTNLPFTTLAAFYNITTASSTIAIPCGACLWMPFEISGTSLVQFDQQLGGTASAVAMIPCNPNLVGANLIVQWTVVNPLASPCLAFPSLSISDRWRMTIGQ